MRKNLMPLLATLALCGAVTGLLIANNAQAQQVVAGLMLTSAAPAPAAKPVMLALAQPPDVADDTAAPPMEGGPDMAPGMMMEPGAHRAQMCKDLYAHKVGALAFLETKLSLTPAQAPLFARWKQVSLDAANRNAQACAERPARKAGARASLLDRLDREEAMLKSRLSELQAERPSLTALYASLTPEQQKEIGRGAMRHPLMSAMMARHGLLGRGPDGAPLPPPPR